MPLIAGNVQLHRAILAVDTPGAQLLRTFISRTRIFHAKGHRADRRAMQSCKALSIRLGFGVDDEVDVALTDTA